MACGRRRLPVVDSRGLIAAPVRGAGSTGSSARIDFGEFVDQRELGRRFDPDSATPAGSANSSANVARRIFRLMVWRGAPFARRRSALRLRRRPARSARPGRHRRRCRPAAAPCGRSRSAFRRGPASARRCARRRGRPRTDCESRAGVRAGVAGADEHAVARERRDRRVDAFDQALQAARPAAWRGRHGSVATTRMPAPPSEKSSRAQAQVISPPSGGAEAAQPLQPHRAGRRQPVGAAASPGGGADRPDRSCRELRAVARVEQAARDRIGPQHPGAVDRPQPGRQVAGGLRGQHPASWLWSTDGTRVLWAIRREPPVRRTQWRGAGGNLQLRPIRTTAR